MDDQNIIALYWARSETAISETAQKYGGYCFSIAKNILTNHEDAEESVNDTYLTAWNAMPPRRPPALAAFLGKITRNLALDRYRYLTAEKRGGTETALALEELKDCVSGTETPQGQLDAKEVTAVIRAFLDRQPEMQRNIFLRRYWHMSSIRDIATAYSMSESKVTSLLFRQRKQLKTMLEKAGINV